ncbi:AarF/UbiB family protein [Hirschia maritima]|uniref:AarF/UbiB family protein n=1 Tax=Hirschia maritima TaxID=1121961 RepID=UPI0003656687|nr:AarF/UbiB family protein [Hirschia maritima]
MFKAIADYYRLARACATLAKHDVLMPKELKDQLPWPGKVLGSFLRIFSIKNRKGRPAERLANALENMGPAYIKLGQFLATRPDIIGFESAQDLSRLKDKVPPFPLKKAEAILKEEFPKDWNTLFPKLEKPVAAASISQVHKIKTDTGYKAVKILRPGVEKHIAKELRAMHRAASLVERFYPDSRRLRPVDAVATLKTALTNELDFRFEAGAASEFHEIVHLDDYATSPQVDWERTGRRILCTEWVDGIPMTASNAFDGVDKPALANKIIRSFLATALDHGFFHADLHEGNMILQPPKKKGDEHQLALIDFGIVGRMGPRERLFYAEVINGFLKRDYKRLAKVHFEHGYVPADKSMDDFAQALRSVGEPIFGQSADNVAMDKVIIQLFDITEQFGMRMRPELVLMQKTMVQVEGVARSLDPRHDIWAASKPVVERWVKREFGPEGAAKIAKEVAIEATDRIKRLPEIMDRFEGALTKLEETPEPPVTKSNWVLPIFTFIIGALAAIAANQVDWAQLFQR